MRSIHV